MPAADSVLHKPRALISRYPRFADENFDKNQALVDRVRRIAERKEVKPGQLALAWVLAKGDDLVPIPGTKRRKYLEENAAAADIKLSPAEVAELEAAVPLNEIAGERYTPANMSQSTAKAADTPSISARGI